MLYPGPKPWRGDSRDGSESDSSSQYLLVDAIGCCLRQIEVSAQSIELLLLLPTILQLAFQLTKGYFLRTPRIRATLSNGFASTVCEECESKTPLGFLYWKVSTCSFGHFFEPRESNDLEAQTFIILIRDSRQQLHKRGHVYHGAWRALLANSTFLQL